MTEPANAHERWKETWELIGRPEVTNAARRERLLDLLEGVDLAIHRPGEIELEFP
jgi:hypothetical protein